LALLLRISSCETTIVYAAIGDGASMLPRRKVGAEQQGLALGIDGTGAGDWPL